MRIKYDENVDALYIRLRESECHESDEIKEGFILDYDEKGNVIGLEILDASLYLSSAELSSVDFKVEKILASKSA